jgi:hypothetical protein
MIKLDQLKSKAILISFTSLATLLSLTGCQDIKYDYDIPKATTDCTAPGTEYRSGGTGVVDRNGGTGVVDRNGADVKAYCDYDPCIPPQVPIGDVIIKWDPDGGMVNATQSCQ